MSTSEMNSTTNPAMEPQAALHTPHGFDGPDQVMVDASSNHASTREANPLISTINPIGNATALNGIPPGLAFQRNTSSPMKKGQKRSRGTLDDARSPIGTPSKKGNQHGPPLEASTSPPPSPPEFHTPPPLSPIEVTPRPGFAILDGEENTHDAQNVENALEATAPDARKERRAHRHAAKWDNSNPADYQPPAELNLVPAPMGGFPLVHGLTSEDLRRNVDDESLALWSDLNEEDYCLAYLAFDPFEADKAAKVPKIRDLIKQAFNSPRLIVSSPGTKKTSRQDRKPIHPYLISGLERDQIEILVQRAVWSTPTITLFAFPSSRFMSTFVMTLRGLSLYDHGSDNLTSHDIVAAIVSRGIRRDRAVHNAVDTYQDQFPSDYTSDEVLNELIDTIDTQELETKAEGTTVVLYNIYIRSPTSDYQGFQAWLSAVRGATYVSLEGHPSPQPIFNCSQCRGIDHPTGLCPFYDLAGWHLKPYEPNRGGEATGGYNSNSATRFNGRGGSGRDRGRGFQGRGRGRGGRNPF